FPEELPEALILMDENGPTFQGSPVNLPGFQQGCVTVQDVGASWVSAWLNPQPGDFIIDLCAAPGGKTAHLAAFMENKGTILAVDSVAKRMDRFHQNMSRLGVTIAEALVHDVVSWNIPETHPPLADGILLDAPCSGLGTIRRHPEILVQASVKKLEHFPNQQLQLLKKASSFLKPGGILVYSTCSVDKDENQGVIETFLKKAPHFQLEKEQQLLISTEHEGFYMAKLKRIS
ncbi:MAG: RsmB/NOP family class I SAM-dependent RNA methyltransferase, partial [Cyanobacteria bacterium]|nr:RsmB/NOP family class I SAM-dependent RNA methyltransferase [Cyanobacteriota bacterium]